MSSIFTNRTMERKPVEILIKVPCSDRLPSRSNENYLTVSSRGFETARFFNGKIFETAHHEGDITYWYEPATRVVLTVEEWETLQNKINLLAADNGRLMAKHNNP